ncbi:tetratricopeptide repeat protein [Streptomyces scabiei]|uniref:tetratricopeptide repeat protein n=1 Tax=Streptomyces scabiei TaxID=1930 RepID=UPI0036E870CF
MAVDQLPGQVREFAGYLNKLMTKLDQGAGWCAVFWQRDPEGMRACLDGLEVPPWDVVEALMHDLDTVYGPAAAAQETQRARALHRASLAAYDSRPGGREALGDRLDVMLREQRYAADRTADLTRRLQAATSREEADSLRLDLAWAHDDHERASARCTELRTRIEDADRRAPHHPVRGAARVEEHAVGDVRRVPEAGDRADDRRPAFTPEPTPAATPAPAPESEPDPYPRDHVPEFTAQESPAQESPAPAPVPTKQRAKRRPRGGARFAGAVEVEEAPPVAEPKAAPSGGRKGRAPRGARYAGVGEPAEAVAPTQPPARQALDDEARQEVAGTVQQLVRLRREGRSGEAHALLVEVAHWPAARFPLLAAELHRAGLDADWATLLWEAGSLPADRLVAVADALNAVGRAADGEQMLRQGVTRPAEEIGEAVLGFVAQGRDREARALLDVYVRVRTPEEAARSVEAHPRRLAPLVLAAARGVSKERHRDVTHALRVQGLT